VAGVVVRFRHKVLEVLAVLEAVEMVELLLHPQPLEPLTEAAGVVVTKEITMVRLAALALSLSKYLTT
jgi:hypothetical protein